MFRRLSDKMQLPNQGSSTATTRSVGQTTERIKSQDLFVKGKEIEIDHEGRIYRLRLTQLNKLILTA